MLVPEAAVRWLRYANEDERNDFCEEHGMSIDLYVFVDHSSPLTVLEWQQASDANHFPLRLDKSIDLKSFSGFFPVLLKNKKTGFYFGNADVGELGKEIPGILRLRSTAAYDFNYGGHFLEGASAYYVAAALVATFNGRAFDPESGKWLDSKELKKIAGELETMGASEKGIGD
jgi:hypothetical protein